MKDDKSVSLPVYEVYKEIRILISEDMDTGKKDVWFLWHGRMQHVEQEELEADTLENKLQAAKGAIDLLLDLKGQGLVCEHGWMKGLCKDCK